MQINTLIIPYVHVKFYAKTIVKIRITEKKNDISCFPNIITTVSLDESNIFATTWKVSSFWC